MWALFVAIGLLSTASVVQGNRQIEKGRRGASSSTSFGRPVQIESTGAPWPMPREMLTATVTYPLSSSSAFRFYQESKLQCKILDQALERYFNITFFGKPELSEETKSKKLSPGQHQFWTSDIHGMSVDSLTGLAVNISDCTESSLALDSPENYTLDVSAPHAVLNAKTIWGALRGLETFSQLVYESPMGMLIINKTIIADYPRFKHRGFLVDSSRHFLPVEALFQFLDAMAYNKFNVFHWHIVDDQSFPYESQTFPYMSQKGAYSPSRVYTKHDVQNVIKYALYRGIRVIPEFDTPGHTQSWGSVKDLLTPCADKSGKPDGTYGPMNPILNSTYTFLEAFYHEIDLTFPDQYVHVGGDEVRFDCWKSNKDIQNFMSQMGYGQNYSKLESYYVKKLLDIVEKKIFSNPIVWQEVVDNGAKLDPSRAVVHVWKTPWESELYNVTKLGYTSLLSTPWYLNVAGDPYTQPWKAIYSIDPQKFNGSEAQKALVLGGEACMWGEYVDATNLIQRSWPRGCAVAERLWSSPDVNDLKEAAPRIAEQRCRMVRRGLDAEPITGPGFCRME